MNGKRQKTQLELAFPANPKSEASRIEGEGIEPCMADHGTENRKKTERLMEEICEDENLRSALKRVRTNKGAPGVDGMKVQELPCYLEKNWLEIREKLITGTYKPQPVKRVEIPKPSGGLRKLGIPTVLDRLIQQMILEVLQPIFDPLFSDSSYGFRPGRSAHRAVARAQEYVTSGNGWVVDIDLEKFFDRVNHDMLMAKVAKEVEDKRLLKLIRAFLNAGVLENGLVQPSTEGTPQGGPLSPLLSNIFLNDLDKELERRGHRFVRYADDCNIYVQSERAGLRVMESISRFIAKKLKLKVNESKSAVGLPHERKFLSFTFTNEEKPRRRIAPVAKERFKDKVRKITRRNKGVSLDRMIKDLRPYIKGWLNYFGFIETPSVLKELDGWIRRRLRAVIWRQWKRGKVRFRELRKLGIGKNMAATVAGSPHGPWRLSRTKAMSIAFPNLFFDSIGLPRLYSQSTP